MKIKNLFVMLAIIFAIVVAIYFVQKPNKQGPNPTTIEKENVVINEALRTLLYLPLYHAKERGFFDDEGINLRIDTGGTATNATAAMLSGEAQFSQADPMYVPISREQGADTVIVAQVVGRIAVWAVTKNDEITDVSAASLKNKTFSTHPRPMTAYTYTRKLVEDAGLDWLADVTILESRPGTEIGPLLNGKSDIALTLEPGTSIAVSQGARVLHSYPLALGDQVFTGLMAKGSYLRENEEVVMGVMKAYQRSLTEISDNPVAAIKSAKVYFPDLDETILEAAVNRMVRENVFPKSIIIPRASWDKAVSVRVAIGDLKKHAIYEDNNSLELMQRAVSELD